MIAILSENPLLLLFIVAALGYGLGSIRIGKSQLGVAAVLFVGLVFGALDDALKIPDIVFLLGLSMFVYTIGLSNGPGFFDAFRQKGATNMGFVFLMQALALALAIGLHVLFQFEAVTTSGLLAGSGTNTPALAGLLDAIGQTSATSSQPRMIEAAVVGYSITYPMGVLACIFAIALMQRLLRIDYEQEAEQLRHTYPIKSDVHNETVEITNEAIVGIPLRDLVLEHNWVAVFGRVYRGEEASLTNWDTSLQVGDRVTLVGARKELQEIGALLGKVVAYDKAEDSGGYDIRRVFVSNPEVAGQTLASLNLPERYQAIITRVRRGDVDLLARGDTVLELGDRIRFIAREKDVDALVKLFGDSYQSLSQINLLSFGLGMAMGLLLGMVQFELPGEITFKLGFAGGPLIVALVLGALRRTGPVVWTLPYSASLTLRQIGLILLLASVGIRSGHTFLETMLQGGGGYIFLAGLVVTVLTALATLWLGHNVFHIPFSILTGMVSSQPAVVDYAQQQSRNQLPNFGYTLMFPIAMILKIVFVQLVFALLR